MGVTDRQTSRMVEPVQRWRIAFSRGAPTLELGPPEINRAWEDAIASADIPVVMSAAARPRPRLTFAAPLPPGRVAEHDLADLVLSERWPISRLRSALGAALPPGFGIVELYDVWLGAPSITAALAAVSTRGTIRGASLPDARDAAQTLLAAGRLERTRAKGAEQRQAYDLRPLILELEAGEVLAAAASVSAVPATEPGAPTSIVRMLLRSSSDGPSGRPDEVIAALGEVVGHELELVEQVRERLWTSDEAASLRR